MDVSLHTLPLRCKKDIVLSRQIARQIAGLLGFSPDEQMRIAAAAFEMAQAARQGIDRPSIEFVVRDRMFEIVPMTRQAGDRQVLSYRTGGRSDAQFAVPLPAGSLALETDDLKWAVDQLVRLTPVNLFEELQQQNREYLRVAEELQRCRAELAAMQHRAAA